jgi:glycosyltransferase involved in cell wall biosynthesis
MDVVGGGERQLRAYLKYLNSREASIRLYDMWNPLLDEADILHCFSVMPGTLELCGYVKNRGLKLVVSPNLWITPETRNNYPYDLIWNHFELADAIVVNSVLEKQTLSRTFSFPEEKFHIVYNGVEPDFVSPADSNEFISAFDVRTPYVLNVANVEPRKNQLRFLKALLRERPDLSLIVVGGVRDEAYAQACREIGGDRFRIVGMLPYASTMLRSALCGCSFFAMPSLLETPSIAAIEAAAMGARILLTEQGATTEYFGPTVTYVSPESDESIASGIHSVLESDVTNSQWLARDRYLWPQVIPEALKIYKSLM